MKINKFVIFITFLGLVLSGCNNPKSEEARWFDSENDAIQNGLEEEGLNKGNIISKYDVDGELFLIYKKEENNQLLVGLSNIANKDNKYRWYRNDSYVNVKNDANVNLITQGLSENEFIFYTGMTEEKTVTLETDLGNINPYVDQDTGIYYYLSSNR